MHIFLPPLRSCLFVPAANARALEKSSSLAADALIFDLEDSAAPQEKPAARERLREHLGGAPGSALRVVRVNSLQSEWGTEDLLMARGAGADAILLPKIDRPEDIKLAADALAEADAPAGIKLWAMVETPAGILDVAAIATSSERLAALVVGPNDIALETGMEFSPGRPEILPLMTQIALAARRAGIAVLDGVYNDFRDMEGFAAECAQARRLGFDGKTLIHPAQVEAANKAFAPQDGEIAGARAIVAAFAKPENQDKGVLQIEGRMVERLHLKQSEALLAFVEATVGQEEHQ